MSTEAAPSLTSSLTANLPPLPYIPGTEPERCILDSFRTAIAKLVSEALPPLTVEQVYTGVDYGKKGVDFTIALPRFRLPGKVDEHAKKVLDKVSWFLWLVRWTSRGGGTRSLLVSPKAWATIAVTRVRHAAVMFCTGWST